MRAVMFQTQIRVANTASDTVTMSPSIHNISETSAH